MEDCNFTDFLDYVLKYSAIIGAIVTFFVTYGKLYLQKKNQDNTIKTAILSEISRLLHVISLHEVWWKGCCDEKNTDFPLIPFTMDVYDNFINSSGYLSSSFAAPTLGFYGSVKFLNSLQEKRNEYKTDIQKAHFEFNYLYALWHLLRVYSDKFDDDYKNFNVVKQEISKESLIRPDRSKYIAN